MRFAVSIFVLTALTACSADIDVITPPKPGVDNTDAAYDLDHLLRVEIEMAADDWDSLRRQTRTLETTLMLEDCQEQPFVSPFTWFEGSVTLDGQHLERVDVRKKGFLGSLSEERPALKLDLGEYDSDPAIVRQCVTYAVFDDLELASPRCSLAQVSVNGDDLGIYVNVEPIKEPMLARHFEDDGVRQVVATRQPELNDFIDAGLPDWPYEPRESYCMELGGAAQATVETTWDTIETSDVFTTGSLSMDLDFGDGEAWSGLEGGAVAGGYEGGRLPIWRPGSHPPRRC